MPAACCRRIPADDVWLPYLGGTLDAGMATLFAFEIIEACKYLIGPNPVDGIWLGAASDVIIRERGIEFVDGSAPGFAAVVGAAPDKETAVKIARELQEKNLYVFMAGNTNGVSFAEQLVEAGVRARLGDAPGARSARTSPRPSTRWALPTARRFRSAASQPGDYARNLKYNKDRIFAFVMALGEVDEEKYAAAAGAISYGFPTIADTDIPQILPTGICTYEHVVSNVPHRPDRREVRSKSAAARSRSPRCRFPVAYGAAFEGERIRKEQTHVEFGGNRTPGVRVRDHARPGRGRGRQDRRRRPGCRRCRAGNRAAAGDLGRGRRPQDAVGLRVDPRAPDSPPDQRRRRHLAHGPARHHLDPHQQGAKDKGFTIKHLGEILHAKLLNDYPAIVDKVQVTLFTDQEEVEQRLAEARRVYRERNQRVESMTDESVDTFYSCLLCQSFAPNHVCVITPERLGLCGAYNWLDGKAAYEIDPTGPNQPLIKGECLDPVRGQWKNINDYVYTNSKQTIRSFNAYSHARGPDDQLRLLRGDRRDAAGVQRRDDRQPRIRRRDARWA